MQVAVGRRRQQVELLVGAGVAGRFGRHSDDAADASDPVRVVGQPLVGLHQLRRPVAAQRHLTADERLFRHRVDAASRRLDATRRRRSVDALQQQVALGQQLNLRRRPRALPQKKTQQSARGIKPRTATSTMVASDKLR